MSGLVTSRVALGSLVSDAVLHLAQHLEPEVAPDLPDPGPRVVPRDLRLWLARLRLLEAVPFSHLVADSALLPQESIRFFHLDRGWTDALVEGALSVGTVTTGDRTALEALYRTVRDEVDEAERLVRMPGWEPGQPVPSGPGGPVTGFLLRSRLVSGWPGLHVRGYGRDNLARTPQVRDRDVDDEHDDDLAKLHLLRMERLAPAVLLVLFDGLPRVVHLEEPRAGVQYGVDERAVAGGVEARVPLRDVDTGLAVEPARSVRVPFRRGAPGVLHLAALGREFVRERAVTNVDDPVDAAEFGVQMLQFPWRAVFGDRTLSEDSTRTFDLADVFTPRLAYDRLVVRFTGEDG